jgi:hypothetical protein
MHALLALRPPIALILPPIVAVSVVNPLFELNTPLML